VLKFGTRIQIPAGVHYGEIETARGILGVTIVSQGKSSSPSRLHFRTPNFNNLWAVTEMAPGWRIADVIAILSSMDLVIPDIDR
jgi:NADH-quinone oxidoreductase subunit D/NADH-quinone oxidoreductase subunit C/D